MDILIVGCGIAGSNLASCLLLSPLAKTKDIRITILERAKSMRPQGQNVDIRGEGVAIIHKLGLETAIRESTTGEEGVQFVDSQNRTWASFAADKTGKVQTGTSDIEILRGRLAELCWKKSQQLSDDAKKAGGLGITYIFGDSLSHIKQHDDRVEVQFKESGQMASFDIVVGADGLQSQTRLLAWGAEAEGSSVKRLGVFGGFFSMPRGKTDSSWRRWFHAAKSRSIMVRPDASGERTTVFMTVVSDTDERLLDVASRKNGSVPKQKEILKEYFADAGWESGRIIKEMMSAEDFYYDALGQVKMDTWSKGRVVLLGDAGYCASPFSGMGTTLALTGAYTLAGVLAAHPDDYRAAFSEYESSMRPIVSKAQKLAPGMPRLFHPETTWGVGILHAFVYFLHVTGLFALLARNFGPPADKVSVKDYGIREANDL